MARAPLSDPRRLARRLRAVRDDLLYPEARSGAEQWQRVELNRAVAEHLRALGPAQLDAVEISGSGCADLGWRCFQSLDYPAFDVCAPRGDEGTFDVVICEQVLEHVIDPFGAARTLRALARPGGHVVVSTPFLVRVHELEMYGMRDYWRFTPNGLRQLLQSAGLTVDEVSSWGNRRVVVANFDRWPALRRWHPTGSEPDLPVQVWAFATNPL